MGIPSAGSSEPRPSTVVPRFLLAWFVVCTVVLLLGHGGNGDVDVGELMLGIPFTVTYPFFLGWLLVRSVLHLKRYRFDAEAPGGVRMRVYVWCFTAAVYLAGVAAFVALEVFGLKSYLR